MSGLIVTEAMFSTLRAAGFASAGPLNSLAISRSSDPGERVVTVNYSGDREGGGAVRAVVTSTPVHPRRIASVHAAIENVKTTECHRPVRRSSGLRSSPADPQQKHREVLAFRPSSL